MPCRQHQCRMNSFLSSISSSEWPIEDKKEIIVNGEEGGVFEPNRILGIQIMVNGFLWFREGGVIRPTNDDLSRGFIPYMWRLPVLTRIGREHQVERARSISHHFQQQLPLGSLTDPNHDNLPKRGYRWRREASLWLRCSWQESGDATTSSHLFRCRLLYIPPPWCNFGCR